MVTPEDVRTQKNFALINVFVFAESNPKISTEVNYCTYCNYLIQNTNSKYLT